MVYNNGYIKLLGFWFIVVVIQS